VTTPAAPLVLKLGGELLEAPEQRARIARLAAAVAAERRLVVVHGGGRAVDAELARRAIEPRKVDGLRITDEATLDAVVAVLAGSSNTEVVAALVGAGLPAVGLTGVDAGFARAVRSSQYRSTSGATVDLGCVGDPVEADPTLVRLLVDHGYVPVIASLGLDAAGPGILNVNADVMACRVAASLRDCDLVIAGGTPGVLGEDGSTLAHLSARDASRLIRHGTANKGMVAKLHACRSAVQNGVGDVIIGNGRRLRFETLATRRPALDGCTQVVR
jgi:acetylglutamate kinase